LEILKELKENARIAKEEKVPICQDTGMAILKSFVSVQGTKKQMTEEEMGRLIDQIKDPLGILEMFSLPSSILRRSVCVGE
jgi:tartrate dehydratase alpha subunit/fumarate hydratase class I-like protein